MWIDQPYLRPQIKENNFTIQIKNIIEDKTKIL